MKHDHNLGIPYRQYPHQFRRRPWYHRWWSNFTEITGLIFAFLGVAAIPLILAAILLALKAIPITLIVLLIYWLFW